MGAVGTGALVVAAAWYLHVPISAWVGYKSAAAGQEVEPAPTTPRVSVAAEMARGDDALAHGRWADAVAAYDRVVGLEPSHAAAHARSARHWCTRAGSKGR